MCRLRPSPPLALIGLSETSRERLARHRELIVTLARLDEDSKKPPRPRPARPCSSPPRRPAPWRSPSSSTSAAERARLAKEIAVHAADIERAAKKLDNADFLARAPDEVVEENRERLAESEAAKARLEAALARLRRPGLIALRLYRRRPLVIVPSA